MKSRRTSRTLWRGNRGIVLLLVALGWIPQSLVSADRTGLMPSPLSMRGAGGRPVWEGEEEILLGRLDGTSPLGLVILSHSGNATLPGRVSAFGVRILAYRTGEKVEENPEQIVPGDHTADGASGKISWESRLDKERPITLRWRRVTPHLFVGQVSGPRGVRIALETYQPWTGEEIAHQGRGRLDSDERWAHFRARPDRRTLMGELVYPRGLPPQRRRFLLQTERTAIGAASFRDGTSLRAQLTTSGHAQEDLAPSLPTLHAHAALSFDLSQENSLSFVATLGHQWEQMEREVRETLRSAPIEDQLGSAEERRRPANGGQSDRRDDPDVRIQQMILASRRFDPGTGVLHLAMGESRRPSAASSPEATLPPAEAALYGAVLGALIDPEAAKGTIRLLLSSQQADGRVPLSSGGTSPPSVGRSLPPLLAWATLKIYLASPDLEFLAWCYPRLLQWNQWWYQPRDRGRAWRDGNGDGLLEWGVNVELEFGSLGAESLTLEDRRRLAATEGGLTASNSSEAPFNASSGTFEVSSIGLNSLYALDTECLALLASELGLTIEAERLFDRYQRLRTLINTHLWDEELGLYVDRGWDGRSATGLSLSSLYPMLAGIPEPDRLKRMMTHLAPLLGTADLLPIRTVGSYLIYQGLRRYGEHQASADLANFLAQEEKVSTPAAPDPLPAIRLWPTVEELLFLDHIRGLTIGSLLLTEQRSLDRVGLPEGPIDLLAGPTRTLIRRRGKIELECEGPVRLYGYRRQERTIGFQIETLREVRLLTPGEEGKKITVTVDQSILGSTSVGASASFRVPAGTHRVLIVR
jgi:hypothetical protein